ncbi:hypothetical protein [Scleromatobacter humisilvae]|uniref:DUF1570 domain-containing protein n=1 Tax=Scleromatobacter humisilvae TaxID=2897159 RepID=A0A9X1YM44_9BURK|nr:hypothetical protein [Scleromatobacter humisilvae]MCK9688658.1 hypothetical protein [Scleromatobacter humisilvae]
MSLRAPVLLALVAALATAPAAAAVDPVRAQALFREAAQLCGQDGGALWHHSLCGPILLVDWTDNTAVANQPDPQGTLKPLGPVFAGMLPPDLVIANTPIEWEGRRWTELLWPLPDDVAHRHVTLSHELFHRAQLELGMVQRDGGNLHLDTLDGRILLQLEWHALARALTAPDAGARRDAISDALLFRHERYRLFPDARAEERALELNEGVAEYTGVRVGLPTSAERTAYALRDLETFIMVPTFVRSFAYATGPAWGLLLDQADPAWRDKLAAAMKAGNPSGLDEMLQSALKLPEPPAASAKAREADYDDTLRPRELARDQARQAHLAELKARLVDGPVLRLPLAGHHASYQFNPTTLEALGAAGVVYPTMTLSADWGVLSVEQGALLDKQMSVAAVAAGTSADRAQGPGWHLTLNKGWSVAPGGRAGDFVVKEAGAAP